MSTKLAWLALAGTLNQIGDRILRLPPRYSTHAVVSLLAVAVVIGVSIWVLERRVRGVEVVS